MLNIILNLISMICMVCHGCQSFHGENDEPDSDQEKAKWEGNFKKGPIELHHCWGARKSSRHLLTTICSVVGLGEVVESCVMWNMGVFNRESSDGFPN